MAINPPDERTDTTMNAADFMRGMTVFTQDDVELGEIRDVWANIPAHGFRPIQQYLLYGPGTSTDQVLAAEDGFLQIRPIGTASSGSGPADAADVFIPFSAVHQIDSLTSVTLRTSSPGLQHAAMHPAPRWEAQH